MRSMTNFGVQATITMANYSIMSEKFWYQSPPMPSKVANSDILDHSPTFYPTAFTKTSCVTLNWGTSTFSLLAKKRIYTKSNPYHLPQSSKPASWNAPTATANYLPHQTLLKTPIHNASGVTSTTSTMPTPQPTTLPS